MKKLLIALGLSALQCVALSTVTAAGEHIVRVVTDYDNMRMYFKPKQVFIEPGDTVTWVNEADETHNIMTFPDGFPTGASGFLSPDLTKKGEVWSQKLTVVGTYEYHCLPHIPMGMHGTVIVGRPTKDTTFHVPTAAEVAEYRNLLLEYFDEDEYAYKDRGTRRVE